MIKDEKVRRNIIHLFDLYHWREHIYFVFPFMDGDLEKLLREGWRPRDISDSMFYAPLPECWLWKQMQHVSSALSYLHNSIPDPSPNNRQVRAFHFDLKPANILVSQDGTLKITDFGQSFLKVGPLHGDKITGSYRGGDFIYAAPEVDRNNYLEDAKSAVMAGYFNNEGEAFQVYDVWSLGCIMIETLICISERQERTQKFSFVSDLDERRMAESSSLPYYFFDQNQARLKLCVVEVLSEVHDQSLDTPLKIYHEAIRRLLLCTPTNSNCMLDVNPKTRLDSAQVCDRLKEVSEAYERAIRNPDDIVYQKMKRNQCSELGSYKELGWRGPDSCESFLEMYSILHTQCFDTTTFIVINVADRENITIRKHDSDLPEIKCRLQLLNSNYPWSFRIKYGAMNEIDGFEPFILDSQLS